MDAILEPIGEFWNGFLSNPIVQLASQLIVIYVVLLWLGTAYWAFRDMQARTENPILPYFAAALIIFFTPLLFMFAVVLFLIVRPRETLAEVYERSLAEESLLAEVEKNELCPVCRDRVDAEWLVCPNCRTRLHRVCPTCNRLAEPSWPLCAFCGTDFGREPRMTRSRGTVPVATIAPADDDASAADATAEHSRLRGATNL
jgi:double zinc ribbon protein